jgi:hypothetical protein
MTKVRRTLAIGLGAIAVIAASCGGGGSGGPSTTPSVRPSSPATISVVEPKNGAVVHGSTVHLLVAIKGARIVRPTSTHIVPTQGHVHVYLDARLISMNYGLTQTIRGVKPGTHELQVEFVASDHLPWNPRIRQAVSFTVKP